MKSSGRMIGLMMLGTGLVLGSSCGYSGSSSNSAAQLPAQLPAQPQPQAQPQSPTVNPSQLAWAEVLDQHPDPTIVTSPDLLQRITATGLPWRVRHKGSGIEMLLVPPGTFMMGASPRDSHASNNEIPQHEVTISSAFYIGRYEVTQAQWQSVMDANPSHFRGDLLPVDFVLYDDIALFLNKAGGGLTLPTEAQWEYACRAGSTSPTYGDINLIAWDWCSAAKTTITVGMTQPNALGLYDTLGNVWEWCSDWYGAYSSSPSMNPTGPSSGKYHVLRGGSWKSRSYFCRASERHVYVGPGYANYFSGCVGFRAARAP